MRIDYANLHRHLLRYVMSGAEYTLDAEVRKPDAMIQKVLTPDFLARCSRFSSSKAFFEASGCLLSQPQSFLAMSAEARNAFVKNNTTYSSWDPLFASAMSDHLGELSSLINCVA
jgi:hypothetical protein